MSTEKHIFANAEDDRASSNNYSLLVIHLVYQLNYYSRSTSLFHLILFINQSVECSYCSSAYCFTRMILGDFLEY